MANIYVDSNATGGSQTGADWANAYLTLAAAAAVDVAGDIIWVAHNHSESTAGAVSLSWAGTQASPTRIICANSGSGEPPTTLATTATAKVTGNVSFTIVASGTVYVYGIAFTGGETTNNSSLQLNVVSNNLVIYESCDFIIGGSNANASIFLGDNNECGSILINCRYSFAATGQELKSDLSGTSKINGGSFISGTSTPSALWQPANGATLIISGLDFSNLGATFNFCNSVISGVELTVRNCKLPTSWSGSLNASTPGGRSIMRLMNVSSTDTNYDLKQETQFGSINHETTLVRTGGASDGTTTISWNMTSNADAEWNHQTLDSPEIVRWNETTGSSITVTVEILHDSLTNLQDDEIWLEVQYLGTSGFPLSVFVNDAAASYVATPADQATSTETWTTTGMSNPNEQKLSVSFTPQEKGFIHAVVKLAKASYTVYVDPLLTVS